MNIPTGGDLMLCITLSDALSPPLVCNCIDFMYTSELTMRTCDLLDLARTVAQLGMFKFQVSCTPPIATLTIVYSQLCPRVSSTAPSPLTT
jgi:hypothetical protein